jgi:hypothetical protein
MAEWSKAPDSSSGPLTRAWVQIPLLTKQLFFTVRSFVRCGYIFVELDPFERLLILHSNRSF